ncbi:MAG TPA: methyltransferase [Vicinamibacterales bacterium]|nr:methyltransferase [Vicinamibacterales bacterium]
MKELLAAQPEEAGAALGLPMGLPEVPSVRRRDLAELVAKIVIVVLFTLMAVNIALDFAKTGRPTGLLLLASEALVVVLTVVRRAPADVDRSVRARVLTIISTMGPPLVRPASLVPLAPEAFTVALSICGLSVVIAGKLSLGRSFGLMPANRGIVCSGLYRLVRHPIYMGYLMTHVGFLAAHPSVNNIVLLATADIALLARAVCEERTLARDPGYRAYQQRVRWRVAPGLF